MNGIILAGQLCFKHPNIVSTQTISRIVLALLCLLTFHYILKNLVPFRQDQLDQVRMQNQMPFLSNTYNDR
jgi:hypothetical protein